MLRALYAAAKSAPAGGAATGETIVATAGAAVVTAAMLAIVAGHRSGRLKLVDRVAAFAERSSGIPGWSSLPIAFVAGSLAIAVLGMYWDISIHIDEGRDEGPLANAAHYLILIGLFGIFFAGLLSISMPKERPSTAAVRLMEGWYAPLGGLLMLASSSFALGAFPMDDVWHRIFGQDVTLWGPTHLVLIGGAGLATVGALILLAEGVRSRGDSMPRREPRWLLFRQVALAGSFLVALSTFQAEFDFSVPQFRLVWHPILLMLAAGIGLVTARLMIGRGGALAAVVVFLAIRGLLSLYVGPLTGHTPLHFPLYVVAALVVEGIALRVSTERPIPFGAAAGLGIGTLGLAAEWLWTNVWYTTPWTGALVPEGIVAGVIAGVAGGVIGAFVGGCLRTPVAERRPETRRAPAAAAAAVAAVALFAWALQTDAGPEVRATVTLTEVTPAPNRTVNADVKLEPNDAAEDSEWFNATAWQGGGSVVEQLREGGPGEYRTTTPLPVHGNWKSTLRLQNDRAVAGLPVFMPADPAIPVKEIPAPRTFERSFVLDKENLLREQKEGVSPALTIIAYLLVLAIGVGLIASLAWGLRRFARKERVAA